MAADRERRGFVEPVATLTPAELREQARHFEIAAESESNVHLRRGLASHALAPEQLARKMEGEKGDTGEQNATSRSTKYER